MLGSEDWNMGRRGDVESERRDTFCCCLWSFNTSWISSVKFSKPSRCTNQPNKRSSSKHTCHIDNIQEDRTFSALIIWSGAIVFFDSCSQISFASEEIRWMNSKDRHQK